MKRIVVSSIALLLSLAVAAPVAAFAPFEHTTGRARPNRRLVEANAIARYFTRQALPPMKVAHRRIMRMTRTLPRRLAVTGGMLWERPSRRGLYHGMRD